MLYLLLRAFFWVFTAHVFAETINVEQNFSQKEIIEIQTPDIRTPQHELLEYYLSSLFEDVPYLNATPMTNFPISNNTKFETFVPNFETMQERGSNYMILYTLQQSFKYNTISYIIFDALYQNTLFSSSYQTKNSIEHIAANIANEAYFAIAGEFGFFLGKLFFTERSPSTGFQVLYSKNLKLQKTPYTNENTMITSPSYCQNGEKVFFASRNIEEMDIYGMSTRNGKGGKVKIPSNEEPYLLAPEASKDCSKLFISSLHEDGSKILMYDITQDNITTILNDSHINTSPIFHEEAKQIYYISNKILPTKIWTTFLDNPSEKYLVSRGLGGYIYHSLSPDGTKIAFVKILNSKFYLGVMESDGSNEILLKTGYIIEEPSWAPYGTNLIVAIQDNKKGPRKIYSVSTKTGYSYPLKIAEGNIVQANWIVTQEDIIPQIQYH